MSLCSYIASLFQISDIEPPNLFEITLLNHKVRTGNPVQVRLQPGSQPLITRHSAVKASCVKNNKVLRVAEMSETSLHITATYPTEKQSPVVGLMMLKNNSNP